MSDQASPPGENLIRAVMPGVDFVERAEADDLPEGSLGLLRILFSPVNEWAHIRSAWEGDFMERFAPGAWKKTIGESASKIRALFQHGQDPQIGDKPLGPFHRLEESARGGYAEVALLDTSYNRDLLPGLKAGLYGSSHRFKPMRYEDIDRPEPSDTNPDGIKERTIKEARLRELGPVTWPAYEGATAGVRSLTDEFLIGAIRMDPDKAREMFDRALSLKDITPVSPEDTPQDDSAAPSDTGTEPEQDAPSEDDAGTEESHLADERREDKPPTRRPIYGTRRKETSKPWLLGPSKSTKRS
jgi:HK97 family phage prohead protease